MTKSIISLIVVASLAGCASPAQVEGMVSRNIDAAKVSKNTQTRNSIFLSNVSGGSETNPLWASKVSDADFKAALEQSLKEALLLSGSIEGSKYLLEVKLLKLEQPILGFDLKVVVTAEYILKAKSSGKVVYSKNIVAPFTATISDSAVGVKRLRIANEGAVRSNIEQFIDDLLSINIDEHAVSVK
ncbi:MAG: hypothetical protein OEV23_08495 [Gallionella sp.]|nr:hypothetical protein [Gallionella sp.]